ncbi:hypothetical protein [Okibacterium fritillariae]|uniref:DUF1190 domain-containing protein n=1 Tax=Okibacterium fritillariae TaxID=123320 RepID=A0A1T5KYU9_9MICO|nr:hypothetical protein [Okibacterium fritillariae]SKC68559.1 hypothetical protein SAMN06309945_2647 [Okibacterium fritillariae]
MRSVPSSGPSLSGIARTERAQRGVAVVSIAGAVLALSGCAPTEEGIVLEGADGEKYVMPENAERPMYDSKEACIADVTAQIQQLESQGETIADSPEDLCESSDAYPQGHYGHLWLGPILFAGSRWNSPAVAGWANVPSGGFAAPGSKLQSDVVSPAPAGATTGQRAPLKGGFGSSGKSGFGSAVGGGSSVGG